MLKKLIKYEFGAQRKVYLGGYGLVAVLAIISRILKEISKANSNVIGWEFAAMISGLLMGGGIFAIWIGTLFMAVLRFRKNFLKDEGYLMHTLPVTENQLVLSKTLTSVLWAVLHFVYTVLVAVFYLGFSDFGKIVHEMATSYFDEMNAASSNPSFGMIFLIELAFLMLLGFVNSISQVQMCLSIGYRAKENKDLMSLVAYGANYIILQIVSMLLMAVFMVTQVSGLNDLAAETQMPIQFFVTYFAVMILFVLILSVIYHIITVRSMKYHLNLE